MAQSLFNLDAGTEQLLAQLSLLTSSEELFETMKQLGEYTQCISLDRCVFKQQV